MDKNFVKEAFDQDAEAWILDAYRYEGFNYPVALDRMRLVRTQVNSLGEGLKVADLGCGGGDVAIDLAMNGHCVDGVDSSEKMIGVAKDRTSRVAEDLTGKVSFNCADLANSGLEHASYDVVTAMGVIGYLETDESLFEIAAQLLKPGGVFLVSCRNRLFNMVSVSHRTVEEIKSGAAKDLIAELDQIDTGIPPQAANDFIASLKQICSALPDSYEANEAVERSPSESKGVAYNIVNTLEPRQHTPRGLDAVAAELGFVSLGHLGVHPHLINPRINKALPPTLFNRISDCLQPLASLPVSLTWSSVFIGVYERTQR